MKKGDIVNGTVKSLSYPNKGRVQLEDRVASVKGVIPGQEVSVRIKRANKERCQATLLEVVKPSLLEDVKPFCPHFGVCGGCSFQTMSYDNQLKLKYDMIYALLEPYIVKNNANVEGILRSPKEFYYRNKMEYTFGDEYKGGPLSLGMHKKHSTYDVVYTNECKIVDDDFNRIVTANVDYFREKNIPFYHKITHEGVLRFLVVRRSETSGELLANLVVTGQEPHVDEEDYVRMLKSVKLDGEIAGVLITFDDSLADAVVPDETRLIYGRDYIEEEILGLRFNISPYSFFQTNTMAAGVLYDKVRDYVGETRDKVIFDLYSGTGTIGQILSPVARKVIGIEIVEEAVIKANANARLNGLDNCEFISGDVFEMLDTISDKPDIIVLDPPRDGLSKGAISKIIGYNVPEIVYVSCKPTSLLRDLEFFEEGGYVLRKLCMNEQYPQTCHVEVVAKLVNNGV